MSQLEYDKMRQAGVSIPVARRAAAELKGGRLVVRHRTAQAVMAGCTVQVTLIPDPAGWEVRGREIYGDLVDEWEPGCLRTPPGSRHRWYRPSHSYWEMRKAMMGEKMPRQECDRTARRLLSAQMRRTLAFPDRWYYVTARLVFRYRGRTATRVLEGIEYNTDETRNEALERMLYREAYRGALRMRAKVAGNE